jgi:hypothetical protein
MGALSLLPYVAAFAGLLLLGHWLREHPTKAAPPAAQPPRSGQPDLAF